MKLHQGEPQALSVSDLSVRYGGVSAVTSVSFTVEPGQSVGLIGANGAGKTSTLRAVMGLVPRAAGELRFGDRDLSKVAARDMVRLGIGYVPEGRHVFAGLTVEKNLLLGAYARRWDGKVKDGLSLLLVEQNAMLTFETTTYCLVLENGEVALSDSVADLSRNARVRSIYIGL